MLKFLREAAVYNFDQGGLRFMGVAHDNHVVCRVTKEALLACTDADDASASKFRLRERRGWWPIRRLSFLRSVEVRWV